MKKTGNTNLLDEYPGAVVAMSGRPLMRPIGRFTSGQLLNQVDSFVVNCYIYADGSHSLYDVDKSKELLSAFQIGFTPENREVAQHCAD